MELTNEDVADILALLDSLPYDELDLRTSRFRLTLRREPGGGWTQSRQETAEPQVAGPAAGVVAARAAASPDAAGAAEGTGSAGEASSPASARTGGDAGPTEGVGPVSGSPSGDGSAPGETGLADVAAPLPGTFYRAPRPGAAPFVEVGSQVSEGTVVAIVETMKLMNSVHAGIAGRVARVLAANGEPVAQGAVVMRIEPAP
jgi:acetyl-CoA carboxylase biotin carboxyl carrier protein